MGENRLSKAELRKRMLARRDALSVRERVRKSRLIGCHLQQLPEIRCARTIMLYLSMGSEVITDEWIKKWQLEKQIVVPVTITSTRQLLPVKLADLEDVVQGVFNIREPRHRVPVPPAAIDVVVVPGIAFDRAGNRLGYGGGYYDRFLSKANVFTVAPAFGIQVVSFIPADDTDIPVQVIVTEGGVIECNPRRRRRK